MKRLDLIRHLLSHGCQLLREGANHAIYFNPINQAQSAVPRHRESGEFTARGICKQLGLPLPT